jgi:hypothetical protein
MPKPILIGSNYNPGRGGHAPGDIRDAFVHEAIPAFIEWMSGPEPTVEVREQQIPISRLCGLLWNCSDTLPSGAVFDLNSCDIELKRHSYSAAARWMKEAIAEQLAREVV